MGPSSFVMGFDFRHSIEIERPAAEVFDYVANPENNPTWQSGMQLCRWTSEPLRVGATYEQQAAFMGKTIETRFRVTRYEPGVRIDIESTQSTFPIQVTRSVEALGAGRCRVTAHVRGQPTGVLALMSGMVRRSIRKDYSRLATTLEGQ